MHWSKLTNPQFCPPPLPRHGGRTRDSSGLGRAIRRRLRQGEFRAPRPQDARQTSGDATFANKSRRRAVGSANSRGGPPHGRAFSSDLAGKRRRGEGKRSTSTSLGQLAGPSVDIWEQLGNNVLVTFEREAGHGSHFSRGGVRVGVAHALLGVGCRLGSGAGRGDVSSARGAMGLTHAAPRTNVPVRRAPLPERECGQRRSRSVMFKA